VEPASFVPKTTTPAERSAALMLLFIATTAIVGFKLMDIFLRYILKTKIND
jgi:hypothetical protein